MYMGTCLFYCMYISHTHKYTHTHTYTHKHSHTLTHTLTHTHTHTNTHTHTHAFYLGLYACAYTFVCMYCFVRHSSGFLCRPLYMSVYLCAWLRMRVSILQRWWHSRSLLLLWQMLFFQYWDARWACGYQGSKVLLKSENCEDPSAKMVVPRVVCEVYYSTMTE